MSLKHGVVALVVILCAGLIQACMDDADAQTSGGSAISRAEYDALLARVTALEANQPGDKVYAGNVAAATASMAKAASAVGKPLGTMVGHLPPNLPVSRSQFFSLKSSTGVLYAVLNERSPTGKVGIATYAGTGATGSHPVYFAAGDCSGVAHVPGDSVSDYGASQGLAFMIGAGEFNEIIDDPAQYLYIATGTVRVDNFAYGSRTSRVGFCEIVTGTLTQGAYPAFQNDPAVTGVDSAPVASPVTLEAPAGA